MFACRLRRFSLDGFVWCAAGAGLLVLALAPSGALPQGDELRLEAALQAPSIPAASNAGEACLAPTPLRDSIADETRTDPPMRPRQGEVFFGDWGVELENLREDISPGDDFYRFVNGRWLDETPMPADALMIGARTLMRDRNAKLIEALVHEFASNSEVLSATKRNIGALYKSFMDSDLREKLGISVLESDLEWISQASNLSDLATAFAKSPITGWKSPFTGFVETDFNQPDRRVYFLDIGGLGMSGTSAYLSDGEPYANHRSAYRGLLEAFLNRAGYESVGEFAAAVLSLETRIAEAWPSARQRGDFASSVHAYRLSQVAEEFPGFDWWTFFQALGIDTHENLIVRFPESVAMLVDVIQETPLEVWRAYLSFHLINGNGPYLNTEIQSEQYRLFTSPVYGTEQGSTEQGALRLVQRGFSFELGRAFVERHFPASAKREVEAMFESLKQAFKLRLDALEWMDSETKAEAYAKLESIRAKIGYPDVWREEPDVLMAADDLMGNLRQLRADRWRRAVQKIGTAADPQEWGMSPQSAGAGFHPALNEITVPAGNLMPPFFDERADDAVNYGAIGGVLGHELLHAFDNLGRHFDATGAKRDWWTAGSAEEFERRAELLVTQFGAYEALPGIFVDGQLTLGENIADVFGLSLAFDAYQASLGGEQAPVLGGYTGEQRLFMGWAQMRKAIAREELMRGLLQTDSHSPSILRVNGVVRNVDAWYQAFEVTAENDLYIPEFERADIW